MLEIYTMCSWNPISNTKEYYTEYEYDGTQTLCFDISVNDEIHKYLKNEVSIRNEENQYLIKSINKRKNLTSVICSLDTDAWKKEKPYPVTKENGNFQTKTLSDILEYIKPVGWKIINANITSTRRTIELEDVTSYDILMHCQSVYNVVYEIRCLSKEIYVIDPESYVERGLYITPELNLDNIEWKGSSDGFCTRLYAYGKDGLSFGSINKGKEYIENTAYSDKVISMTWRDARYTVADSLLEDSKKKLKELGTPNISYCVTVNDIGKVNSEYNFLNFRLYDKVNTVIDKDTSILQNIVKYRVYHNNQDKNIITLSSEAEKITSKIDKITTILGDDGKKFEGSILQQAQKEASQLINDFATRGHRYETESEIYFLDKLPKENAKYVMRQNLGGIAFSQNGWQGPYVTAWTIDSKFNADFITTGVLRAIKLVGNVIEGGSININDRFLVDANGNMTVFGNGKFKGRIDGSIIEGSNIIGSTFTNENGSYKTEISNGRSRYYYGNDYVGNIGTNNYKRDASKKGLGFDLENDGSFMSFSYRETSSADEYIWKLVYAAREFAKYKADSLNLGTNLYTQGNRVYFDIENKNFLCGFSNGGGVAIPPNGNFPITTYSGENHVTVANFGSKIDFYKVLDMHNYNIINQSDERLKTNIKDVNVDFLHLVNLIKLKEFDWIEDGKHVDLGIIAQDLQEILPSVVHEGNDGVLSISSMDLIYYVIGAIQKLSEKLCGVVAPMSKTKSRKTRIASYSEEEKIEFVELQKKKQVLKMDATHKMGNKIEKKYRIDLEYYEHYLERITGGAI